VEVSCESVNVFVLSEAARRSCTWTLPSRRKPSPESRRQQPRPAATGHQTRYWPSWKPSEYAEHVSTFTAPTGHDAYREASTRHNPGLGIFPSMPNSA